MCIEVQKGEQACWHVLGVSIWSLFLFLALNCSHCVIVFAIILLIILLYFEDMSVIYAISAYHHWCCELDSRSGRGVQHYVDFSGSSGFLHQQNWQPRYNWNMVESGVKHHQTNKQTNIYVLARHALLNFDFETTFDATSHMQCTCVHGTPLVERDISGKSRRCYLRVKSCSERINQQYRYIGKTKQDNKISDITNIHKK